MKFLFRVDASRRIGSGHVMRCLTLAQSLKERGAESTFLCRSLPGHLASMIELRGFRVYLLPYDTSQGREETSGRDSDDYASWLGETWENDAVQTISYAERLKPDWMVVDHYALDADWEQRVRPYAGQLFVLDDLANRPHVSDMLLDQNLGRTEMDYKGLVPERSPVLTGPSFMLLRREFGQLRRFSLNRRRSGVGRKVLVTMGGSDEHNATGLVLSALGHCRLKDELDVTVVMSSQSAHLNKIRSQIDDSGLRVDLQVDVSNMARHMADSDLAIGAVGGTAWERCCLGLPTLMVVIADNQLAGAKALASVGAAALIGGVDDIEERLASMLEKSFSEGHLGTMAELAAGITDGAGVDRVVSHLLRREI